MLILSLHAAFASCPKAETVAGELTCSSKYSGIVLHNEDSHLGGDCDKGLCYTCGDPHANEEQLAPEAVYSFQCQQAGTVAMLIDGLTCDLDIYVLDGTCDPYGGCLYGSTNPYAKADEVTFDCVPGDTYYIVVEAYGTDHLDVASGPCTDPAGDVYSPTYTLSFDVSASTGCAEDCDDGDDNDLDGDIDCDDTDCWTESMCCDADGDNVRAEACGGTDCDDSDDTVYTGAPEDGGAGDDSGDGLDNDCDDIVDEGTNAYDDDGDGYSEDEGDCDDGDPAVHPGAEEIEGNGVDDDCDDSTSDDAPEDTAPPADSDQRGDTDHGPPADTGGETGKEGECGCGTGAAGFWLLALLPAVLRRRA